MNPTLKSPFYSFSFPGCVWNKWITGSNYEKKNKKQTSQQIVVNDVFGLAANVLHGFLLFPSHPLMLKVKFNFEIYFWRDMTTSTQLLKGIEVFTCSLWWQQHRQSVQYLFDSPHPFKMSPRENKTVEIYSPLQRSRDLKTFMVRTVALTNKKYLSPALSAFCTCRSLAFKVKFKWAFTYGATYFPTHALHARCREQRWTVNARRRPDRTDMPLRK